MKSRMEKYETKNKVGSRTERNKELYNKINEDETYTNIEGVISTPVKNEIDIKKLQETIEKHEEAIKDKKYTQPKDLPIMNMKAKENPLMDEDDDSHDIKEILNKAIKEKEADELDKYRSLKIAEMNLIKKMKKNNKDINIKEMDKEIKSQLKAMVGNDKEALNVIEESACLDIFSELENDQEKTKDNKSIKEYINEAKKQDDIEDDLDKSFYTDSMHFDAKDFEDDVFENVKTEKKSRKALKIIAFILFLILIVVIGYFLYPYIKK